MWNGFYNTIQLLQVPSKASQHKRMVIAKYQKDSVRALLCISVQMMLWFTYWEVAKGITKTFVSSWLGHRSRLTSSRWRFHFLFELVCEFQFWVRFRKIVIRIENQTGYLETCNEFLRCQSWMHFKCYFFVTRLTSTLFCWW